MFPTPGMVLTLYGSLHVYSEGAGDEDMGTIEYVPGIDQGK